MHQQLGIRWTIGNVSSRGFEALRLSVWGAWRLFGPAASYAICLNSLALTKAQARTGTLPPDVQWHVVTMNDLPRFLRRHVDGGMAEGVAWKLAPVRLFPDRYELSLDNDCILWEMPEALRRWLAADAPNAFLFAEDVARCLGQFDRHCATGAWNSGIRGLPPGFAYEIALARMLLEHRVVLQSELDEQGLQAAVLQRAGRVLPVRVGEVSICSPFPPHLPRLGRCGAHFVGLNAQSLPWSLNDRPAVHYIAEHWERHRQALYERVGVQMPAFTRPA